MQITGGTITLALGSNVVSGSSSCDWSQVVVNNWLLIAGQIYIINAADNTAKTLGITPSFAGISGAGITDYSNYTIVRDFTANHGLPLLNPGDLEAAALWSRAMNVIDAVIGGSGGDTEIQISQVAHGFVIGNVIRYDSSSGWTLASSDTKANATIIGIVSSVTDADHFGFRTQGQITGVSGLSSVTPGTVYYLRSTAASPNLVSTAPSRIVPAMVMISDTVGYIMTLATNEAGVFALLTNGLVPGPTTLAGKFLRDDGSWAASVVSAGSLSTTENSVAGTVDWTAFFANNPGLSLSLHIRDLHTRLLAIESSISTVSMVRTVYNRRNGNLVGADNTPWTANFTLPAGINRLKVQIFSGTAYPGLTDANPVFAGTPYRIPSFLWDDFFANPNPTASSFYGHGLANNNPFPPNAYELFFTLADEAVVTIEVGPLRSKYFGSTPNYASVKVGSTVLAYVESGVAVPQFAAIEDGLDFYHAIDPNYMIGELFAPFEFKTLAYNYESPNQWGVPGYFSGMVIVEYGGQLENAY